MEGCWAAVPDACPRFDLRVLAAADDDAGEQDDAEDHDAEADTDHLVLAHFTASLTVVVTTQNTPTRYGLRRASRIATSGAGMPVHRSNDAAPWNRSTSRPSTTTSQPALLAAVTSAVSRPSGR